MEHSEFKIGTEFTTEVGRWRCTDVGTRVITAIRLNHDDDPSMYLGPPYKVVESVFDEYDLEGLEPAPAEITFDHSGEVVVMSADGIIRRCKASEAGGL